MKISLIYATIFAAFTLAGSASADSVPLVVGTYNFQLDGGGGGAQATLNGVAVQIFCDNFNDEIYVPSDNSANVTQLSTSADLDETRFGDVSSWTTIDLAGDATDQAFLNTGANGRVGSLRHGCLFGIAV